MGPIPLGALCPCNDACGTLVRDSIPTGYKLMRQVPHSEEGSALDQLNKRNRNFNGKRGSTERSSRQGRSLAGCKSPHRQLPVFGRLAYPMRGEATNRVLLGRKSPGCLAGVFATVGTIWGASKLGGRNITKYLQPRKSSLARSRFKRDNCG